MRILEIIHLRSVQRRPEEIRRAIQDALTELDDSEPVARCYCHVKLVGDLSVHLSHETTAQVQRVSHLGLRLAAALKEYGLVEHSVWFECSDDHSGPKSPQTRYEEDGS